MSSYLQISWQHLAHHCWKPVAGLDGRLALSNTYAALQNNISASGINATISTGTPPPRQCKIKIEHLTRDWDIYIYIYDNYTESLHILNKENKYAPCSDAYTLHLKLFMEAPLFVLQNYMYQICHVDWDNKVKSFNNWPGVCCIVETGHNWAHSQRTVGYKLQKQTNKQLEILLPLIRNPSLSRTTWAIQVKFSRVRSGTKHVYYQCTAFRPTSLCCSVELTLRKVPLLL